MQNLQRESKTPYGNQRKITVVVSHANRAELPVLNALRQSEENHRCATARSASCAIVLNALRQSEENHGGGGVL